MGRDRVVARRIHAKRKATAHELDMPFVHISVVGGGKVVAGLEYTETRALLAAAAGWASLRLRNMRPTRAIWR